MLLQDYSAYGTADMYIEFVFTISWFRMYCAGRFGENKNDYLKGLQSLEDRYRGLWYSDDDEKSFSKFFPSEVDVLIDKLKKLLSAKRLEDKNIIEASNLLFDFINNEEGKFRNRYFEHRIEKDSDSDYPAELFRVVKELLDNDHNDEAILNAFKYLDSHLQRLLQLSPHDYHGEDLINKAFAPNTGALQLGTHPNEQTGLRNFFSGANAVFRNPSAHRFMRFENFDAATIVAMTAVMARMATQIAKKNQQKDN